jgi:hypothetical protein
MSDLKSGLKPEGEALKYHARSQQRARRAQLERINSENLEVDIPDIAERAENRQIRWGAQLESFPSRSESMDSQTDSIRSIDRALEHQTSQDLEDPSEGATTMLAGSPFNSPVHDGEPISSPIRGMTIVTEHSSPLKNLGSVAEGSRLAHQIKAEVCSQVVP